MTSTHGIRSLGSRGSYVNKGDEGLAQRPPKASSRSCSSCALWIRGLPVAGLADSYSLLGLQSYFTAGEKEIRAWTIPVGATAPQAAGVIHTDFERGFIRCETYSVDDLDQYGSEKSIRDAGKLRIEGKTYVMQDSDVCNFLFNV